MNNNQEKIESLSDDGRTSNHTSETERITRMMLNNQIDSLIDSFDQKR